MTSESDIAIHGTLLLFEGEPLKAETHTPRDLSFVLGVLGRDAIAAAIADSFNLSRAKDKGATIVPPSISAMDLGPDRKTVLTPFGQRNRTALHRSILEVGPAFRDYWNVVASFDLAPQIRRMGSRDDSANWLLLRNPDTDPPLVTPLEHLPRALGFLEPAVTSELKPKLAEAWNAGDLDTYRALGDEFTDASMEAIDRQSQSFNDPEVRAYAQIGLIVAQANLRAEIEGDSFLHDPQGYGLHLADANEYALQMHIDDLADALQTEISRVHLLRELK